jgi:hypothetical protein
VVHRTAQDSGREELTWTGSHAGLSDPSLMLAIDPGLVRADRLHWGTRVRDGDGVEGEPVPEPMDS